MKAVKQGWRRMGLRRCKGKRREPAQSYRVILEKNIRLPQETFISYRGKYSNFTVEKLADSALTKWLS